MKYHQKQKIGINEILEELNNQNISNEQIASLIKELNYFKGDKLYNQDITETWQLKYVECAEYIFEDKEETIFSTHIDDKTEIKDKLIKCPYCSLCNNDVQTMKMHMHKEHDIKFSNKLDFPLTYTILMKDKEYKNRGVPTKLPSYRFF